MDLDLDFRRLRRRDRDRSAPKRQRRRTKRGIMVLTAPSENADHDYKVDTDGEEEGDGGSESNDESKRSERGRESQKNSKPRASQNASGSGEIEAAKRSLATAQKWAASTVGALETAEGRLKEAEKCVSDAKTQAKSAREQVEEAEAYLKTVEQKWEVIDVDEDSDDDLARATKRRKQGKETKTGEGARIASKAGRREKEVLTIDSSSDDESSVDAPFDASGRTRLPGDRASIDAVRIAVGKKVFKRGCELRLQLGTRNPYFLFSYLDGKDQKREHSVHLNDDGLKELRYYIDGDDEPEIDNAMTVILFRITPSGENAFVRYPHCYDPDDDTTKMAKRYIAVELRDADEFQAMLAQMQEHPDLELWCGAESKIPAKDLANYTKAFVEDDQREKETRLSIIRRARSGGASKGKKAKTR
ncbi:hypothetical protein ACHAXT_005821 [Thalassiosira profunda]